MKYYLLLFTLMISACGSDNYVEKLIPGPQGERGEAGSNGVGCVVTSVPVDILTPNGGALVTCGSSSVLLVNGEPGEDGQDAPQTPYSIVSVINPCGINGEQDEVLLKFANGTIVSSFSNNAQGAMTRFSILRPGSNYMTTDNTGCYFSVDSAGNIYNEHN